MSRRSVRRRLASSPKRGRCSPALPWNQIAGMRHRLVHAYFQINLDLVWDVVTKDLGPLLAALEPVLPEDPTQLAP